MRSNSNVVVIRWISEKKKFFLRAKARKRWNWLQFDVGCHDMFLSIWVIAEEIGLRGSWHNFLYWIISLRIKSNPIDHLWSFLTLNWARSKLLRRDPVATSHKKLEIVFFFLFLNIRARFSIKIALSGCVCFVFVQVYLKDFQGWIVWKLAIHRVCTLCGTLQQHFFSSLFCAAHETKEFNGGRGVDARCEILCELARSIDFMWPRFSTNMYEFSLQHRERCIGCSRDWLLVVERRREWKRTAKNFRNFQFFLSRLFKSRFRHRCSEVDGWIVFPYFWLFL